MKKVFFAATFALLTQCLNTAHLIAQTASPPSNTYTCSSGLRGGGPDCAPNRRLLVAVTLNGGEPSPEMLSITALAAGSAGVFALTPHNATAADSTIYAVLTVKRDAEGNFRIDQSIVGPRAKSQNNCTGYTTGANDDMGFGAQLALEAQKLIRCAQRARGAPTY